MDPEVTEIIVPEQDSFAKEVGKTLVISTVASMGVMVGIFVTSFLASKAGKGSITVTDKTTSTPESE